MHIGENISEALDNQRIKKVDFAEKINVSRQHLYKVLKSKDINTELLRKISDALEVPIAELIYKDINRYQSHNTEGVPLVELTASAGMGNLTEAIATADVEDHYTIPAFGKVDFLIRASGDSMAPSYNSGDIMACRIIAEPTFLQWGRAYVLATKDQGTITKRITPGTTTETITIISDNPSYKPFEIEKKQITGYALVVGIIRSE